MTRVQSSEVVHKSPTLRYAPQVFTFHASDIQSQVIVNAIVQHVPVEKRGEATRCLEIAVQARNAFAHGAILSLPEKTKVQLEMPFSNRSKHSLIAA